MTTTDKILSLLYPTFGKHQEGDIVIYALNFLSRVLSVGRIITYNGELCIEEISDMKQGNKPSITKCSECISLPYFWDRDMNDMFRKLSNSAIFEMLNVYDTSLGLQHVQEDQLDQLDLFHNPVKKGDIVIFATDTLQYGEVDTLGLSGAQLIKTEDIFDGGNKTFSPYKYLAVLNVADEDKERIRQYVKDDANERERNRLRLILNSYS
jgi:hypothetical protein